MVTSAWLRGVCAFTILLGSSACRTAPAPSPAAQPAAAPVARPQPPPPPVAAAPVEPPPPAPVAAAPVEPPVQTPPPEAAPVAPVEPQIPAGKVLIIGDSMAATDFGRALQKRIEGHERLTAVRRGKSATGLARPDYFDWMSEAERQLKKHDPDIVVVIIGGNDGQDLLPKVKGEARRVNFKKKTWPQAYAERVKAFTRLLLGERRRVAWIELPVMDRKRFERKLSFIRKVQKDALAELGPRVQHIDTRPFFFDDEGKLIRKIPAGKKKKKVDLRQKDGIHFSLPGSQYFADRVYPVLLEAWSAPVP